MSGMVLGICRYQDSLPTRRNNFSWQHPSELQFTFLQKSANGWTITKKLNPNLKAVPKPGGAARGGDYGGKSIVHGYGKNCSLKIN